MFFSMQSAAKSLQQWKQVEISWRAPGEKTVNRAVLLRSDSFLRQQHVQVGYDRTSGIMVNSIQPWHGLVPGRQPVITGIFKYRSSRVKTFTFISRSRRKFQLHATGTHPVYVDSLHRYVNLDDVTLGMVLLNDRGEAIHIQCPGSFSRHCGRADSARQMKDVYDLEVNGTHAYFAGHIPVHNVCVPSLQTIASRFLIHDLLKQKAGNVGHAIETIYAARSSKEWSEPMMELLSEVISSISHYNRAIFSISRIFPYMAQRDIFISTLTLSLIEQETGRNLFFDCVRRSQRWIKLGMNLKMNRTIFLRCDFYPSVMELETLGNSTERLYTTHTVYTKYMFPEKSTSAMPLSNINNSCVHVLQCFLKKTINQTVYNVERATSIGLIRFILPEPPIKPLT